MNRGRARLGKCSGYLLLDPLLHVVRLQARVELLSRTALLLRRVKLLRRMLLLLKDNVVVMVMRRGRERASVLERDYTGVGGF